MIPMEIVDEFVKRVREASGTNVESVILFGSAVAGDFHAGLSNLNLLCILRVSSFEVADGKAIIGFPCSESDAPRIKSIWPPIPEY